MRVEAGPFKLYSHHLGTRDGVDYMQRWILATPWGTLRLHRILRSDADPDLHDHPWDFVSLLLAGRYAEQTERGGPFRPRGLLIRRRAEDAHRLRLETPAAWTLVVTGPKRRSWGFHTPAGFVPWRRYVSTKVDAQQAAHHPLRGES